MLPSAKVGGGHLTIENKGTAPDRLLGGSTEAAPVLQVHKMEMEGGMVKMGEVEGGPEIPAGGTAADAAPAGSAGHEKAPAQ